MVFEIYNTSGKPVFQVLPTVVELTGNKHIHISENVLVESIMPGRGIRYTAVIKADNRLKDGEAVIRISVLQVSIRCFFFFLFLLILIPQFHPDGLGISAFVGADVKLRQV